MSPKQTANPGQPGSVDEMQERAEQDAARDRTNAIAAGQKEVARLEKLVAKRDDMLEAATNQLEQAEYKVARRTEIRDAHKAELEEAQQTLAELQAAQEAAQTS